MAPANPIATNKQPLGLVQKILPHTLVTQIDAMLATTETPDQQLHQQQIS